MIFHCNCANIYLYTHKTKQWSSYVYVLGFGASYTRCLTVCVFAISHYLRLENFTIIVGGNSDWRLNQCCYSQLDDAGPEGAIVEFSCNKLILGRLISINKTASVGRPVDFCMLMLHEVQWSLLLTWINFNLSMDK